MCLDNECPWPGQDPLYRKYHDEVWGRAEFDSKQLFAKLCLDGQQAGLSWLTILRKQSAFEAAFANFEPSVIANWGEEEIAQLLENKGIIRSRLKIEAVLNNARAYLRLEQREGDFTHWLWGFVNHQQIVNHYSSMNQIPTQSTESESMAKALKKAGFKFVGPTICYAFMQAVGMVNDHLQDCSCYELCLIRKYPWSK